jgi:hypothetical protein
MNFFSPIEKNLKHPVTKKIETSVQSGCYKKRFILRGINNSIIPFDDFIEKTL